MSAQESPEATQHQIVHAKLDSITKCLNILFTLPEHLTDKDLTRMNINQTSLNLQTGEPADGSERYIIPFPIDRIHAILSQGKPWGEMGLHAGTCGMPRVDAYGILYVLEAYLNHTGTDEPLISETAWQTRTQEYDAGERLFRRRMVGADWVAYLLLDKMDSRIPHVSCLLADNTPIQDERVSNAEIWCILVITRHRLRQKAYRGHRVIPVTVLTTAGRQLRIVQGYIDGQGSIQVRKSPILDFEGVEIYGATDFVNTKNGLQLIELVLAWCIGETVGCPTV